MDKALLAASYSVDETKKGQMAKPIKVIPFVSTQIKMSQLQLKTETVTPY